MDAHKIKTTEFIRETAHVFRNITNPNEPTTRKCARTHKYAISTEINDTRTVNNNVDGRTTATGRALSNGNRPTTGIRC